MKVLAAWPANVRSPQSKKLDVRHQTLLKKRKITPAAKSYGKKTS